MDRAASACPTGGFYPHNGLDAIDLSVPSRLILATVDGAGLVVQIWAPTEADLSAWMPTATEFVDSIHFTRQPLAPAATPVPTAAPGSPAATPETSPTGSPGTATRMSFFQPPLEYSTPPVRGLNEFDTQIKSWRSSSGKAPSHGTARTRTARFDPGVGGS